MFADPASRRVLDTWLPRFVTGALIVFAVSRALAALGSVNINDDMYVASASLFSRFGLYSEIAYVQTPLSIYVYAALNFLFGPPHLFLAARLLSILLVFGAAGLAAATAFRLFPRVYVFQTAFALLLFNPHIYSNMKEIGSYALPLFFLAAACYLHIGRKQTNLSSLLIGLLIGLATASKLNFLTFGAAFALLYLLEAPTRRLILPYATGVVIGLLPVAYYLLRDPQLFLFLNVQFHLITNTHRKLSAFDQLASVLKGSGAFVFYALPLFTLAATTIVLAGRQTIRQSDRSLKAPILFAAAVFAAAQPMVYFIQYWNAAALVLILFAVPFAASIADKNLAFKPVVLCSLSFLLVATILIDSRFVVKQLNKHRYAPILVARAYADLEKPVAAALAAHPGCVTEILSASGVPAIGAGLPLSPGSAAGSFMFRVDENLRRANSPYRKFSDVGNYMTPHTALLTGLYKGSAKGGDYEERMEAYAAANDFVLAGPFKYEKSNLLLFLPARCRVSAD
ncbi:MAG TPA: hypothetical protein VGN05_04225 [Parvibaculum sp.]|jgi:hypothetical protein